MGGGLFKKLSILFLLLILIGITGVSYAYWIQSETQNNFDTLKSKCFELTLKDESEGITLDKVHPVTDEDGMKEEGYTFTIKNICNTMAYYQVNIEELKLSDETKVLSEEYIKLSLNNSDGKLVTEYEPVRKTIENAIDSHKLTSGSLQPQEEKTYNVKLWMDYNTPAEKETMNATYESKISVIASEIEEERLKNEIEIASRSENEGYSKDKDQIEITATSENYQIIEYSYDNKKFNSLAPNKKVTLEKEETVEGSYPVYFKDEVGNIKEGSYETAMLDQTPPTIEVEEKSGEKGAILTIHLNDTKSGLSEYKIEDKGIATVSEEDLWKSIEGKTIDVSYESMENKTIIIQAKDQLGNIQEKEYKITTGDLEGPSITYGTKELEEAQNEWYKKVTITSHIEDKNNIKEIKYCLTTKENCNPDILVEVKTEKEKDFEIPLSGNALAQKVCIKATDIYENESEDCSPSYQVDKTDPTVEFRATSEGNSIIIQDQGSSDEESGIDKREYRLDSGNWYSGSESYTFTNVSSGEHTVSIRVTNKAGLTKEASSTVTVNLTNVYVSNKGNDITGVGSVSKPFLTIDKAYNVVNSNGNIILLTDLTATTTTTFEISEKNVTLKSNDNNIFTISRSNSLTTQIIQLSNSNVLTATNLIFDGNNVSSTTSMIYVTDASILNLENGVTIKGGNNTIDYSAGGITVNTGVLNIDGATITSNISNSQGGGVYVYNGTLNLNSGTITENSLTNKGEGAGVYIYNSIMNMRGGTISKNLGANIGGGVFVRNDSTKLSSFTMSSGTISDNKVSLDGAGLYLGTDSDSLKMTANITGGTISNNTAASGGGAIMVQKVSLNLSDATIFNNMANYGGAIYIGQNANFTMNSGEIRSNTADYGGGIHATTNATLTFNDGLIEQNIANINGGGIDNAYGNIILNQITINNNTAKSMGGGIFNSNGTLTLENGKIQSNTADYGGGVSIINSNVFNMKNGYIQNNTALQNGGGVDINNATFNFQGGNITGNIAKDNTYVGGVAVCCEGIYHNTGGVIKDNIPKDTW